MAKIEQLLQRQAKRLAKAKEELDNLPEGASRRVALERVTAHQRNVIRLEGRLARKLSGKPARTKGQKDFYTSAAWKQLRYKVLATHERRCACCGASPANGAVMHVDHVKPRSTHPELALDIGNLQILCADCNLGKSNFDDTDFR